MDSEIQLLFSGYNLISYQLWLTSVKQVRRFDIRTQTLSIFLRKGTAMTVQSIRCLVRAFDVRGSAGTVAAEYRHHGGKKMRLVVKAVACTYIALVVFGGLAPVAQAQTAPRQARSIPREIEWVSDYAEAKRQAQATGRPMIVFWSGAPDTGAAHKAVAKWDMEESMERLQGLVFTHPNIVARSREFVWVKVDYDNAVVNKALGITENFDKVDKNPRVYRPPSRQGFIFARADEKIYGRLYNPITETFWDMMDGVLKAHSPMGSDIRKAPYATKFRAYTPYRVPYGGRPQQHEFPPHSHSWRECPKCREALAKAMNYLKSRRPGDSMSALFAGFAFMMAEGSEKELAHAIEVARNNCKPQFGGYANWNVAHSMLLLATYSRLYGLTPANRAALVEAQQFTAEQVDDGGGWFHHPKQGGVNYAWDISLIGTMFYVALLQMEAMGLEVEPSLTLARGYLERRSDGWSIGYGHPFPSGRWGSVGKNGLMVMGFHNADKQDDPFGRMLGDFLADNPDAPPKAHGTGLHPFFGAAIGTHLLGPEHYEKFAGYWLHPLIDCQRPDGGIGPPPHDHTGARQGAAPSAVLEEVKNANNSCYNATAILACMILMTEPGAFPPRSSAGSGRQPAQGSTPPVRTPRSPHFGGSGATTPGTPAPPPVRTPRSPHFRQ